jgi:hypothetical protein
LPTITSHGGYPIEKGHVSSRVSIFFVPFFRVPGPSLKKGLTMDFPTDAPKPSPARHHDLDALRAWAMSMGIVLHAAWIMMPGEVGAPKTDASASMVTDYICLSIHTFRMQLFFVLAGLFACLLLRSRGVWQFARNRFLRIALPLVVFWCILCPIMMFQYNHAGIQSGAIQGDLTAWQLTRAYFENITLDSVMLIHLWFLYYLCLAYLIVMAIRGLIVVLDRGQHMREWVSRQFRGVASSATAPFVLAAFLAPPMFLMKGAWGIEIGLASLVPSWPGLVSYILFFLIGWLIFRNIDNLEVMLRGWRWQLALGLLLTVPYFSYSKFAARSGYATWDYPRLTIEDLAFDRELGERDYPAFRSAMISSEPDTIGRVVFELLPEPNRQFLETNTTATENQLNGLLRAVNLTVLADDDLAERVISSPANQRVAPSPFPLSEVAQSIAAMPAKLRRKEQNERLNREILEAGLPGIIYSEDIHRPHYGLVRAAYAYAYSLISWLLIFGCFGLFHTYCRGESRFWRYFSDASYWMYLMHLPIQFQILIWLGDKPWPWPVKFLVYVVATTAILVPSYHYLVRPTWIGWLLNGKIVPRRKRAAALEPDAEAPPGELPSTQPKTAPA